MMRRFIAAMVATMMLISIIGTISVMGIDYDNHWGKNDITYLIDKGYITADGDGNIYPDNEMPRGAMVSLINKIMNYSAKAENGFADLDPSNKYYDNFLIAKAAGYILGDAEGNVNPDSTIIRGEIAVILARLYSLDTSNTTGKYVENDVPLWAMGAVYALDAAGIMKGNADGTFAGYKAMTNAEGYTIAARMARKQAGGSSGGFIGVPADRVSVAPAAVPHTPVNVGSALSAEIKVYEDAVAFDLAPVVADGKIWVSVQPVVELMNFEFYPTENGFAVKNEWSFAELTIGSTSAKLNGQNIEIEKPYVKETRYWMSLDDVMRITNSTYKYNGGIVTIEAPKHPEGRVATDADIIVTPQFRTATYEIPSTDPNAEITVWTLAKTNGNMGWRPGQKKWSKEYAPVYLPEKQAFVGTITYLDEDPNEDMTRNIKVRVRSNGKEDVFTKTFEGISGKHRTLEDLAYKAEKLTLVSTFNNISVYLNSPVPGENLYNVVEYREKGASEWKPAFRLSYDAKINQFKGSIVQVKENTTYEVKVALKDMTGSVVTEQTAETTTWAENVPVAKTINVKDVYVPGKPLLIQNVEGSENGWIKIVGDGKTVIDVTDEYWEAVFVAQSKYIILENLIIKGAFRHGIHIADNSEFIRITNCDISGWGHHGIQNAKGQYTYPTGYTINNDAGVYIDDVSNIVVEKSYMHDPKGKANSWNGTFWKNVHPQGPTAVYGRSGERIVIRYNDFVGSDEHRWNDSLETFHNFDPWGGFAADCDIYGNYQVFGQDDSTELDGSQMNMRYYGNKAEGFLCGYSTATTTVGPSFLFRNLIINGGDELGKTGGAVKNGQKDAAWTGGFSHHFHNTYSWGSTGIAETSGYYLTYTRNNILETTSETGNAATVSVGKDAPGVSFDYDLHFGKVNGPEGSETNGIAGEASFVNKLAADFRLTSGSLGIDKGQLVPNFSEGYTGSAPDMGAHEFGTDVMFPVRPIALRSDKYQVNLVGTGSETVTLKVGNVPAGTTYKILKNNVFGWFEVSGATEGTLTPNSTITLTVKGAPDKVTYKRPTLLELKPMKINGLPKDLDNRIGNGAFIVKLSNGDSLPVTVYLAAK